MPSYAQWRTSADKGQVARVIWLCGDQKVLVEEVISTTKAQLNISEFDYVSLSGESNTSTEIWDAAYQYPLDPSANRLVLVREADKISNWNSLKKWFADSRQLVSTYIIFVSDQADYPTVPNLKQVVLQTHVELIRTKGKTVRCSLPSTGEVISWIMRNSKFAELSAGHLLSRAGGDMNIISNVCKKSIMFAADPGTKVIDRLTEESAEVSFSDALVSLDKRQAFLALKKLPESEYALVIGQLYSRLDLLHTLHRTVPNFSTVREVAEVSGIKVFLVQKYGPVSKHYDSTKLTQCRNALTIVDDAVQRNATTGAMELLVSLW
jgi:hypothetical protein